MELKTIMSSRNTAMLIKFYYRGVSNAWFIEIDLKSTN